MLNFYRIAKFDIDILLGDFGQPQIGAQDIAGDGTSGVAVAAVIDCGNESLVKVIRIL